MHLSIRDRLGSCQAFVVLSRPQGFNLTSDISVHLGAFDLYMYVHVLEISPQGCVICNPQCQIPIVLIGAYIYK